MNDAWVKNCDSSASGRLRSLWDIMKPFHAELLMAQMNALGGSWIHSLWSRSYPPSREVDVWSESDKASFVGAYASMEMICIELELIASRASVKKIRDELAKPDSLRSSILPLEKELSGRLIDEMGGRSFFSLSISEAEYFKRPFTKWEKIIDRFPDIRIDLEESSKCFALSRYAAAVFHSTQLVEIGLLELGRFIHVADPKSGWTAVANELSRILKKKYDDRTQFEQQNFAFLEQIQGTVEALKNACRNKIGHAQGRLTLMSKDFTPDIAEEILIASRAFMRRLADGLPPLESGMSLNSNFYAGFCPAN
jgi:hypothetical protein